MVNEERKQNNITWWMLLLLLAALAAVIWFYTKQTNDRQRLEDELEQREVELQELQEQVQEAYRLSEAGPAMNQWFTQTDSLLVAKEGLQPQQVRASLRGAEALIPIKGVLGGEMQIFRTQLLGPRWAIAYFEDGHRAGLMLLEYAVQDAAVEWEMLRWLEY